VALYPEQAFWLCIPEQRQRPRPLFLSYLFGMGRFFGALIETPTLVSINFLGKVAPISHEPGRPRQALRYTTRGDGGRKVRPIKKTWLGSHLLRIQRGKLSGAYPSSDLKKGETLRAFSASLSSVGLSRVMALWALHTCALVGL
jgi:hypothetical protein